MIIRKWHNIMKKREHIRISAIIASCKSMLTNLHCLSSLLCICEQLNGERPGVMQHVLQVRHTVAHMSSHTALPTDGHRATLAEKTQHLWEDKDRTLAQLSQYLPLNQPTLRRVFTLKWNGFLWWGAYSGRNLICLFKALITKQPRDYKS